jgi:hypothetical protein
MEELIESRCFYCEEGKKPVYIEANRHKPNSESVCAAGIWRRVREGNGHGEE